MNIKQFKYDEVGLSRFFGPLEAKIMGIIWGANELSIKSVQARLELDKPVNFNTIMTVMNRLVEKGFLKKRHQGRLSLFQTVLSKEDFIEEQSKKITENLIEDFGGVVINHMLDSINEIDQSLIDKLEQKIQLLKKDRP